jgi:hypothetical protein
MKWYGKLRMAAAALVATAVFLSTGCGGGMAQRTTDLLDRNHTVMDDVELRGYYQQLGDQLARTARSGRVGQSRGFLDADKAGDDEESLRQRWNAVRQELRRRELLPSS